MSAQIEAPSMPHGCRKYLKMHKSVARKTPFFICSLMKPGQRKKSHDHRHVIFSIFLHFQIPQVWSTVLKNLFWLVDRKPRDQIAVAGNIIATELHWNSQLALYIIQGPYSNCLLAPRQVLFQDFCRWRF